MRKQVAGHYPGRLGRRRGKGSGEETPGPPLQSPMSNGFAMQALTGKCFTHFLLTKDISGLFLWHKHWRCCQKPRVLHWDTPLSSRKERTRLPLRYAPDVVIKRDSWLAVQLLDQKKMRKEERKTTRRKKMQTGQPTITNQLTRSWKILVSFLKPYKIEGRLQWFFHPKTLGKNLTFSLNHMRGSCARIFPAKDWAKKLDSCSLQRFF